MATFYANARGGSDSNNGTSWALAKATLSGVNAVASAGDTILCHGVFKETIPVSKQLFWTGYGYCEFNGNSGAGVNPPANTVFRNITFTGWSNAPLNSCTTSGLQVMDCIFRDMPGGFYQASGGPYTFRRCTFRGLSNAGITNPSASGQLYLQNCVFYSNAKDVTLTSNQTQQVFINYCLFGSSIMVEDDNVGNTDLHVLCDWNVFDFVNGKCKFAGVDKTTLTTWQAAIGSPRELNSISRNWRSDVGDYANLALRSNPASYLLTAGPSSTPLGLDKPALTISNNTNSSLWTGGVFSNTEIDGFGKLVLSAGQTLGTYSTDVVDFGATWPLYAIELSVNGESYPTTYIDADTGDSPNYLTVEVRGSNTLFAKADVSPSWTTLVRALEYGTSYRYWQVRLTLRA